MAKKTHVPMRGKVTAQAAMPPAESRIVTAVGVSSNSIVGRKSGLNQAIEAAQSQAILDARAAGITDDKETGKRMKAAREKAIADFEAKAKVPAAKPAADRPQVTHREGRTRK